MIACDSWKTGRLTCWWQKDLKSEGFLDSRLKIEWEVDPRFHFLRQAEVDQETSDVFTLICVISKDNRKLTPALRTVWKLVKPDLETCLLATYRNTAAGLQTDTVPVLEAVVNPKKKQNIIFQLIRANNLITQPPIWSHSSYATLSRLIHSLRPLH